MLSNNEIEALEAILDEAIVKSKDEDDGDPLFHDVDINSANPFADKLVQSDVYTSLANKGLIECSATEDLNGNVIMEHVCITPRGFEALKSSKGIH